MTGTQLHATAVATRAGGLLLLGAPGSGKSDLALRLIETGAVLVADDQVVLSARAGALLAAPPPALAGLLEVRGVGILPMPYLRLSRLRLALDLGTEPARLPPPPEEWPRRCYEGVALPVLPFAPFQASAPAKALAVLALLAEGDRDAPQAGRD